MLSDVMVTASPLNECTGYRRVIICKRSISNQDCQMMGWEYSMNKCNNRIVCGANKLEK